MSIVSLHIHSATGTGPTTVVEFVGDLSKDLDKLIERTWSYPPKTPVFTAGFTNPADPSLIALRESKPMNHSLECILTKFDDVAQFAPDYFRDGLVIIPFELRWLEVVIEKSGTGWRKLINSMRRAGGPDEFGPGNFLQRLFKVELTPQNAPSIEDALEKIFAACRVLSIADSFTFHAVIA